jgi:hypothetical protein
LHEKIVLWVGSLLHGAEDLEDISVEIEGVLEVSDLIF